MKTSFGVLSLKKHCRPIRMRCTLPSGVTRTQAAVFSVASFQVFHLFFPRPPLSCLNQPFPPGCVWSCHPPLCSNNLWQHPWVGGSSLPFRLACNLLHPIATGGEGGNNRLQVLERDAHPHLHQVLLLQHAQCRSLSRPGGQAGCGGEGAVHFQVKKGGSQDFVTQAGGEKSQPGVARRPNRELPEEKVLLLREGDVRGSLGWYGMSPLYAVSELTQVISLNLPMVGAVDFAKGDFLKEYGISEMLSTFEVSSIFSRASKLIFTPRHKFLQSLQHGHWSTKGNWRNACNARNKQTITIYIIHWLILKWTQAKMLQHCNNCSAHHTWCCITNLQITQICNNTNSILYRPSCLWTRQSGSWCLKDTRTRFCRCTQAWNPTKRKSRTLSGWRARRAHPPRQRFPWIGLGGFTRLVLFQRWELDGGFAEERDNMVRRGSADAHGAGRHGASGSNRLLEPEQPNWGISRQARERNSCREGNCQWTLVHW